MALGSFDGLHIGHMSVIGSAASFSSQGLLPVVLLFDEHPLKSLSGKCPPALISDRDRSEIISDCGCEERVISFREIKDMTCEEFFDEILLRELNCGALICGFNYRFGKNGAGDTKTLLALCEKHSVTLTVLPPVVSNGEIVSSTKIRNLIMDGKIETANELLGRRFSFCAVVNEGDKRGTRLGFPTINQYFPQDFIIPKYGVYSSRALVDGTYRPAVTNIGTRPTFGQSVPHSETWILDTVGSLYGREIRVELAYFLREEKKFSSAEELRERVLLDGETSKKLLERETL